MSKLLKNNNNNNNNNNLTSQDNHNHRFDAIVVNSNSGGNSIGASGFFKKRYHQNTSSAPTQQQQSSSSSSSLQGLTSMQRFWLEHIVINNKIIDLKKLRPTVGVLPWAESGAPKKFNTWCRNIIENNGFCRFGDKCFNAHPAEGNTIEKLEAEAHDMSVLEGKKKTSPSKVAHHQGDGVISNTANAEHKSMLQDRFSVLLAGNKTSTKKSTPSVVQEEEDRRYNHEVPTADDLNAFGDSSDNSFLVASPQLSFDFTKIGCTSSSPSSSCAAAVKNETNEYSASTMNNDNDDVDETLVPVWRQRGNTVTFYPLSQLNEKSRRNHDLGKTVVECYFQNGCKDPTCTFLHMKPELIRRENKSNTTTEKNKKSVANSTTSDINTDNKSDIETLLELIKNQDRNREINGNNNKIVLNIRG